ncbi:MAG: dephospho-CoA kinase [Pseudomonadota bacterium]
MTFKLGLTGSIGMGKSTAASMFRDQGIPVWDADQAVHELYTKDHRVIEQISEIVPDAKTEDGLDRQALRMAIQPDPGLLAKIESIVHPAVQAHREAFLEANGDAALVVLEIPLIFELKIHAQFDAVAVVSTDANTQKARVLGRGTMSEADFELILSKQVPDAQKRKLADFIIPSDTLETAQKSVQGIIETIGVPRQY